MYYTSLSNKFSIFLQYISNKYVDNLYIKILYIYIKNVYLIILSHFHFKNKNFKIFYFLWSLKLFIFSIIMF